MSVPCDQGLFTSTSQAVPLGTSDSGLIPASNGNQGGGDAVDNVRRRPTLADFGLRPRRQVVSTFFGKVIAVTRKSN